MRLRMCGAVLAGVVGLAPAVSADIYLHRDRDGVLHFTNAPADSSRMFMRERALPPAGRFFVASRPFIPAMMKSRPYIPALLTQPIPNPQPTSYDALIREIADRYDVEYALVKAVI